MSHELSALIINISLLHNWLDGSVLKRLITLADLLYLLSKTLLFQKRLRVLGLFRSLTADVFPNVR